MTVTDVPFQPPDSFHCASGHNGDTAWVRPVGELDLDTAPQLEEALAAVRSDVRARLVLDLSGLTFMDSTGLRLIIRWDGEARRHGFEFAIVPGPEVVQRVIRLTGMDDQLAVTDPPS